MSKASKKLYRRRKKILTQIDKRLRKLIKKSRRKSRHWKGRSIEFKFGPYEEIVLICGKPTAIDYQGKHIVSSMVETEPLIDLIDYLESKHRKN